MRFLILGNLLFLHDITFAGPVAFLLLKVDQLGCRPMHIVNVTVCFQVQLYHLDAVDAFYIALIESISLQNFILDFSFFIIQEKRKWQ